MFKKICESVLWNKWECQIITSYSVKFVIIKFKNHTNIMLCGRVPAANAPDALQPKAYCTNPDL